MTTRAREPGQRLPLLIGESFSPWTKKARWALEYCGVVFDYQEYTPTLSEPGLRLRLRQWRGPVSVPVLFALGTVIRGSWDIAQYAGAQAGDNRLGDFSAVSPWNDLSEAALAEGRTRVVRCIRQDAQALQEALPDVIPHPLRRPLRFLARDAVARLDRKYAALVQPGALQRALVATRERLAEVGGVYLLGDFSYADIAMATVVEVIAPVAGMRALGPATLRCWHDAQLANAFADVVGWRDRLAQRPDTTYSQFRTA